MKTVFSYSKFRPQIALLVATNLSTKFGAFPIKFKGDMHNSLKHVLALCCHVPTYVLIGLK